MTTPARRSYADGADEVIDLDGKLVTPAFVDAHVHTAQTGALLTGLDLAGTTSLTEALDRLAAFAQTLPAGRGDRRRRAGTRRSGRRVVRRPRRSWIALPTAAACTCPGSTVTPA